MIAGAREAKAGIGSPGGRLCGQYNRQFKP
jgi:hypothetical protein